MWGNYAQNGTYEARHDTYLLEMNTNMQNTITGCVGVWIFCVCVWWWLLFLREIRIILPIFTDITNIFLFL